MEIKVIGVGPNVAAEAKKIEEAILKHLGIAPGEEKTAEIKGMNPVEALMQAIASATNSTPDGYRTAKKMLKKTLTKMRDEGVAPDDAAIALAEVTAIFFNGMLKPVEGKTAKDAFMDFMSECFDIVDKKVAKVRAEREEACRGR